MRLEQEYHTQRRQPEGLPKNGHPLEPSTSEGVENIFEPKLPENITGDQENQPTAAEPITQEIQPTAEEIQQLEKQRSEEILKRILQAPSPFKELEKIFPEINTHYPYDELVKGNIVSFLPILYRLIRRYRGLGLTPDELFEIGLEDVLKIIKDWNLDKKQPEQPEEQQTKPIDQKTQPTAEELTNQEEQSEKLSKEEEPIQQKKETSDYLRFKISIRLDYRFRSEIIQRHGMKNINDGYMLIKFYYDSLRCFKEEFGRLPSRDEIIAFMEERIIRGEAMGIMGDTKIGKFLSDKKRVTQISNFCREKNRFPTTQELGWNYNGLFLSFKEKIQQIVDMSVGVGRLRKRSIDDHFESEVEKRCTRNDIKEMLRKALLSEDEIKILRLRFGLDGTGEPMKPKEIAEVLGIEPAEVRRIIYEAFIKIRRNRRRYYYLLF